MYENRAVADFKIEWHFDRRSAGEAGNYLKVIKDELTQGAGGVNLKNLLGIADENWVDALGVIFSKLDDGFINILQ